MQDLSSVEKSESLQTVRMEHSIWMGLNPVFSVPNPKCPNLLSLLDQMRKFLVFFSSHIDEKMLQRGAQRNSKRNDVEAITACEDTVFP